MGKGIDLAKEDNPEHAQILDDFRDQLLIAFLRRLDGTIDIPVKEIDETGRYLLSMKITDGRMFHFKLSKKS